MIILWGTYYPPIMEVKFGKFFKKYIIMVALNKKCLYFFYLACKDTYKICLSEAETGVDSGHNRRINILSEKTKVVKV